MKRSAHYRRTHCTVPGHGLSCVVAHEKTRAAKARAKRDRRVIDDVLSAVTVVGALGICVIMGVQGCASLSSFTDKAAAYQREAEALLVAAQAIAEDCKDEPEPRPSICEHVERLMAAIEPEAP